MLMERYKIILKMSLKNIRVKAGCANSRNKSKDSSARSPITPLSTSQNSPSTAVARLSKWESYYELSPQSDGKVALIIGDKSNSFDFKMRLDSSKLSFLKSDIEVAYVSNQKLYINYAEIVQQLRIGSSASTGYLVFKHMGNGLGVIWES